MSEIVNIIFD